MKAAVVGSREYPLLWVVQAVVYGLPPDTIVVSGGARGVDTAAVEAARKAHLGVEVFPADWERYGRSAGFKRNLDIVRVADYVIAFTIGSKGTQHSIDEAARQGKRCIIYGAKGWCVDIAQLQDG